MAFILVFGAVKKSHEKYLMFCLCVFFFVLFFLIDFNFLKQSSWNEMRRNVQFAQIHLKAAQVF